jgi:hypothetical protein
MAGILPLKRGARFLDRGRTEPHERQNVTYLSRLEAAMRVLLLWLLGIPIPVLILLWLFHVI